MDNISRREILSSATILPMVPYFSSSNSRAAGQSNGSTNLRSLDETSIDEFELSVPTQNFNDATILLSEGLPFFTNTGWERGDHEDVAALFHSLHPDGYITGFYTGRAGPPPFSPIISKMEQKGRICLREGIPMATNRGYEVSADLTPWLKWERKNGRLDEYGIDFVDDPKALAGETFEGEKHTIHSTYLPSVFAKPIVDILSSNPGEMVKLGNAGSFIDHIGAARMNGSDFSPWAREAFRSYLSDLPRARQSELGIDDPSSFDMRSYIETAGIQPHAGENPFEDPVFREYVRFHHKTIKRVVNGYVEEIHNSVPDAENGRVNVWGNQRLGPDLVQAVPFYLADEFDVICIEDEATIPPDFIRDSVYKIGRSMGRYEKNVFVFGSVKSFRPIVQELDLDTEMYRPTLMRIRLAEGYANGAIKTVSLTGGGTEKDGVANRWVRDDFEIDESLQSMIDFVWAHEPYLKDVQPDHRVALIYSLPTAIWSSEPLWFEDRNQHRESFKGAAATLTANQIPYDVIGFGHSELWTDSDQLSRLSDYEIIILPQVECISDTQVTALRDGLPNGSNVIVSGQIPDRTENFEPRADIESLFEDEPGVRILTDDPASEGASEGGGKLIATIDELSTRQVEIDRTDVGINIMRQPGENRLLVHLVNYAYDQDSDDITVGRDVSLTLRDLPIAPELVRWYDDTGITALDPGISGGELELTIPALHEWGFVLVAEGDEATLDAGDVDQANDHIKSAKNTVSSALEEDRVKRISKAKTSVHRATVAAEYGRHDLAVREATKAEEAVARSFRPPVIGIDRSHDRKDQDKVKPLSELRSRVDRFDFQDVTDWSTTKLESVDVLIILPRWDGEWVHFDLTESRLDRLEEFVSEGGSLLLLGGAGMESGVNRIAERFGFAFDDRVVVRGGEGDNYSFHVASPRTTLTPFLPRWTARFGVPLTEVGDAEVIGRVDANQGPADSNTSVWLDSEGGPDASGLPVMAASGYGDGTVAAIGESESFLSPPDYTDAKGFGLVQSVLPTLGKLSQRQSKETDPTQTTTTSTTTKDHSPTTTTSSDSDSSGSTPTEGTSTSTGEGSETHSTETPGFGIVATLTALGSAVGYRLFRDRDIDE